MNKLARSGSLILASSATLLLIQFWMVHSDRSRMPLQAHLPTADGAELIREFKVTVAGHYFIDAVLKPVGRFEGANVDFLNEKKSNGIPCAIRMSISRHDNLVFETTVDSLQTAFLTKDRLGYGIAVVDLAEEGTYELIVRNHGDLSYLDSADPNCKSILTA